MMVKWKWMVVVTVIAYADAISSPVEAPLSADEKAVLRKRLPVVRVGKDGANAGKQTTLDLGRWITDHEGWCNDFPVGGSNRYSHDPIFVSRIG
eukprot:gene30261-7214_t